MKPSKSPVLETCSHIYPLVVMRTSAEKQAVMEFPEYFFVNLNVKNPVKKTAIATGILIANGLMPIN